VRIRKVELTASARSRQVSRVKKLDGN